MEWLPRFTTKSAEKSLGIHPSAVIDPRAEIDSSAEIGPYCVVEGPVRIGAETRLASHVHILGHTSIGRACEIHSFACIGDTPQDRAYKPEISYCKVGDECVIREGVTIHRGTGAETVTEVGSRCMFMANSHVGHNCVVADDVVMVNGAVLGGYVHVGARALLSGYAGIHQFVRIGQLATIGGVTKVVMDVPPFFTVGRRGTCEGINTVGLRRAGFSSADRLEIKQAFQLLYRSDRPFQAAVAELAETVTSDVGRQLVKFLQEPSKRGIVSGRSSRRSEPADDSTA